MATNHILALSLTLALCGCATGNFEDPREDTGRTSTRGDTGRDGSDPATDTASDTGASDTAGDPDDTGPTDTLSDSDSTSDVGPRDIPEADISTPWGDVPDGVNASVRTTIEASRSALLVFCDCCNSRFGSDPELCLAEFWDGGFEPDTCELDAITRVGSDSDGFLGCLVGAFAELENCMDACASSCSLCENNFVFAANRCRTDYPTVTSQLDLCP